MSKIIIKKSNNKKKDKLKKIFCTYTQVQNVDIFTYTQVNISKIIIGTGPYNYSIQL